MSEYNKTPFNFGIIIFPIIHTLNFLAAVLYARRQPHAHGHGYAHGHGHGLPAEESRCTLPVRCVRMEAETAALRLELSNAPKAEMLKAQTEYAADAKAKGRELAVELKNVKKHAAMVAKENAANAAT